MLLILPSGLAKTTAEPTSTEVAGGSGMGMASGSGEVPLPVPMPAPKPMTHGEVMTHVGVVKDLIDAIKQSHSDADLSVTEVTTHAKALAGIQTSTLTELQGIEAKLLESKTKLMLAKEKLAKENTKIEEELAMLSTKWKKLNDHQSKKLQKAEKKRAAEMARLKKMTSDIQAI